jgi:hypothetical protein
MLGPSAEDGETIAAGLRPVTISANGEFHR